jgi:predicted ATPase/class 3 adenylate cyclase
VNSSQRARPRPEGSISSTRRPVGEVTFLFTDIEGSTRLLQRIGAAYADVLAQHHRLIRAAIKRHDGVEVQTEGDAFFILFERADAALAAAVEMQRSLDAAAWPEDVTVAVRMGLHHGVVARSEGEYVGVELHRAARIAGVAHGGQVVASEALRTAVPAGLPEAVALRSLGEHRLKDFDEPVRLYQVDIAGLRTDFPPLASLSARFELLPAELSSFVGREAEVTEGEGLLASTRLLTLTGPGGTGKSRLALEIARRSQERFRHGVAFVPLAAITDPRLVAATIRGALGFGEEPGVRAVETLVDKLHQHELLLLLDNFEQVRDAAPVVAELLAGTERLRILVTSRVALRLEGEQESMVPPMALPPPTADPATIEGNDAVRLFVERARLARPGFSLDARNATVVAEICRRLDGLPLAIELAAARTKLLSPEALLVRLSGRLDVLGGGGATDRRRTLRGTIGWSHDLLSTEEQVLFRRLSIFAGGGSLEAVEALLPRIELDGAAALDDVLDQLAALIDHSLVRQVGQGDDLRYVMLETIREYGLEQLGTAGESAVLSAAHARWFLAHVHALAPTFTAGPEGPDHVERQHADVRAALRWSIDEGETMQAQQAVADLWRFWHLRGHLAEGLAVCKEVASMPGAGEATEAAAGALYAHASLLYWQGRAQEALAVYQTTLTVAREAGSRTREADAQFALAFAFGIVKDWPAAHAASQAAEAIYEELGDGLGATNARFTDAYMTSLSGDWERAAQELRDVLDDIESYGDVFWALNSRIVLAWTLTRLDRVEEARRILRVNLAQSIEFGDRSSENMAVEALATVAAFDGEPEQALVLAGAAQAIAEDLGGKAPDELIVALDPVALATERGGVSEEASARLVSEGRALDVDAARALAQEVASREPAS